MIIEPTTIPVDVDQLLAEPWAILTISKSCWVVLPRAELVAGLKRGKTWRRHAALRARLEAMIRD